MSKVIQKAAHRVKAEGKFVFNLFKEAVLHPTATSEISVETGDVMSRTYKDGRTVRLNGHRPKAAR